MSLPSHREAPSRRGRLRGAIDHVLQNFSSQFFLISQGTGILSILLYDLPYQFRGLKTISIIVWLFTLLQLVLFTIIYVVRAVRFPEGLRVALFSSPVEICCLCSVLITYESVSAMTCLVMAAAYGKAWGVVAYVLFWVSCGLSALGMVAVPYFLARQKLTASGPLPPPVLLPAVAAITSAALSGVVVTHGLLGPRLQVPAIIVGYLLLGIGIPYGLAYSAIFMQQVFAGTTRITRATAPQVFLVVGPLGQGAFALQMLGTAAEKAFRQYNKGVFLVPQAGLIVGAVSILCAIALVGYGMFWIAVAVVGVVDSTFAQDGGWKQMEFNMRQWSMVFPLGVLTGAVGELGNSLDSPAFKGVATAMLLVLLLLWIFLGVLTARKLITGELLGFQKGWRVLDDNKSNGYDSG